MLIGNQISMLMVFKQDIFAMLSCTLQDELYLDHTVRSKY